MRYHTTLSTIVITMAMLLLFSAVAVFCVDSLNITSPGLMLLNKAQERLEKSDLPFSLSFSGIDRIMESEIVIHEAELSFEDNDISIERITVTQNPISLFSRLARREGSIRLELDNVDIVHMPSQSGNEEKSSAGSVDIDSMLDRIASIIEERTDGYLFNFDYEIVLNSADIHIGKSIDMLDCYFELKIDRGLVLRNIYIDIPRMNLQFSSADISLEKFVASIDRSSSYSVDVSFRNLQLDQAARRFTVDEVSAISRFDSLKDIEIRHFPFEGRLEGIHYSEGASSIDIEKVRATSENGTIRTAVDSFELATSDLIAGTERLEAVIVGDVTGNYDLDIDSAYPILLEYKEKKLASIDGLSAELRYNGIYTLDASVNGIDIPYISDLSSSLVDNIHLKNNVLNLQYNNSTLYTELVSNLVLESSKRYIDRTAADFRLGFILDEGSIDEIFFELVGLNIPTIAHPVTGSLNYRDERLSGSFRYSDSFVLSLDRKLSTRVNAEIMSLNLIEFEPLISMMTPVFRNYIAPETTLSGTFRLSSDGNILEDSSIYSSLALSNIRFNDFRFGLAGMLQSSIKDRIVNIEALSMTSEYLRATYSGSISLSTLLPEGHFELADPESGREYFTTDILLNENKAYLFNAALPTIYDSSIGGIVERRKDRSIAASGTLVSGISSYPVNVLVDPVNGIARVSSTGLLFSFDILNNILFSSLEFNSFRTPVKSEEIVPLMINGSLGITFNFASQRIFGSTGGFDLIGFRFLPSDPSIHFSLEFTNEHIAINDIYLIDSFPLLTGSFYIDQKNGLMAGHLGNSDESIDISIMKREKEYSGIIDIENLKLDRYSFENISINSSLIGRGSNLDEFTFSGSMAASPQSSLEYGLRSDIILTADSLKLNNFDFTTETVTLHSDSLSFDTLSGEMNSRTDIRKIIQNKDRDYPIDLGFSMKARIPAYRNFIELVFNLGDYLESGGLVDASIHLDNFSLDNGISVRDRDVQLSFSTEGFVADGDLVNGSYDFESRAMDLTILDNEILSGHFKGSVRLPEYDMEIDGLKFNLHSLVTFMKYPIFYFGKDSYARADLRVYGKGMNTHIFGNVYSDKVEMSTWWVDQDYFVATNLKMTIIDNELDSGFMPIAVINNESGAVREGRARFYGILGGPNFVDHIAMDAHVDRDGMFHIIVPISSYNAQIEGWGWGDFTYDSELWLQHLSGDLYIQDFDIYMGMDPLPPWWESYMQFTDDFMIRFAKNVRFIMPKSDNPMMTAYIKEGDSIHFTYDTRYQNASIDGNINLKGGEIYYINKNFYITEGSFNFPSETFKEPRLSLRARLTDFDSNGDKVDIYLVLNNSTLDNLNPHFESSPQKSMEEIMSILGNAIISNEENSSFGNLSSVATIVTSGMDAMGKAGMITSSFSTRSLTDSIRESLHLDMFSMRTQLLQNVLLDSFFPGDTVYSPMSRYFNNTTVFFGKQVTDNIFLQGLIRLNSKEKRKNRNPFLTDDLLLDFEVSLEWENPIGTVSFFTSPVNLLPYNMYENFGISYRKRIVF